jgi:integrase
MALKNSNKLTARTVATAKPGRHGDGAGLYLVVSQSGARKWVFRFTRPGGKVTEMGLGSADMVTLAEAREKAREARRQVAAGINPIEARREAEKLANSKPTFGECALAYVEAHEGSWRNDKHRAQWAMTLTRYAAPLRDRPVDEVDTEAVLSVLQPLWQAVPETASRLRGRIEAVLDAARAQGHRHGENPARWRGHLDKLLPKRQKLARGHHAAMPYSDVPDFVASLRDREAVAAMALEFCILTAARSGEALGARWSEFDLVEKVWTVPAARMKAGKEHRVPLSGRAMAILQRLGEVRSGECIFPGQRAGKPLSGMAMEMLLRRMGVEVTVHGFRSSFRDWCGDRTSFPRELAEAALAHVAGDETERAYRRSDAIERRRVLMQAWDDFLEGKAADNVMPFSRAS